MSEKTLFPMQQKIKQAILKSWSNALPCAIQIGQRGGKTTIIESILGESSIQNALVVTDDREAAKKAYRDISFLEVYSPTSFESYLRRADDFDASTAIILEEPWFWEGSETHYMNAIDYSTAVLAIGNYNPMNMWTFDALIPKYATWEVNEKFNEAELKNTYSSESVKSLCQRDFGRNI